MQKRISFFVAFAAGVIALAAVLGASASSPFDIEFPIAELGGCADRDSCKAYCDDPAHLDACLEFAEKHGLAGEEEREKAREFRERTGPGGCRGEGECHAYCNEPANQQECFDFAVREGLIPPEEAERIKKFIGKTGPGGCKGEAECRAYCEDPNHQEECLDFAVREGFMSAEEAARAKKLIGKEGPGGCRGEECRDYCENPANAEECLAFAEREGLLPPGELERARKFMRIAEEGGPGGCRGPEECRAYCEDPSNQEACFDFAKERGLIPPEEEAKFEAGRKIQQKMQESGGPGGCRSEQECRAYCSNPSHVEECIAFAAAHGGIPPEEARRMVDEFAKQKHNARFEAHGDFGPPEDFRRFEEEARRRFEEFRQLEEQFRGKQPPGAFPEFPQGAPGEQRDFGPPPPAGFRLPEEFRIEPPPEFRPPPEPPRDFNRPAGDFRPPEFDGRYPDGGGLNVPTSDGLRPFPGTTGIEDFNHLSPEFVPPPDANFQPPPPSEPPPEFNSEPQPSGVTPLRAFFGAILGIFQWQR